MPSSESDERDPEQDERVAANEAIFRRANEDLERRYRELAAEGLTPFLCECGDERCTQTIRLSLDEYEQVRTHSARFAIVPGHQILEVEKIVERGERFDVVEKIDIGRRIAEATEPR